MRIFLGGDASRREFYEIERDVRAIADRAVAEVVCRERVEVDVDSERFTDETFGDERASFVSLYDVDIFLFLRSFPNEFSARTIEAFRRLNPLAPIVVLASSVCEGEGRNEPTLYGTRRFYLGTWRAYAREEFERFVQSNGVRGLFAQTPLASNVDDIKTLFPKRLDRGTLSGEIAIIADDLDLANFLSETIVELGGTARVESFVRFEEKEHKNSPDLARIIVDSVDLGDENLTLRLRQIKRAYPGVPIDLLAFAPRPDEIGYFERRELWGKLRIISKPFNLEYLLGFK